jgi:hypothetical protein
VSGGKTRVWRVLAALVGALVFTATSPFPKADALTSDEGSLLSYINNARAKYGKSRLSVASDLVAVARQHSKRMASQGAIFHNSHLTSDVDGWRRIGENVGRGPSAKAVHDAFMSSSSHRVHILDGSYDQVGIGAVWGGSGSRRLLYITEVFVDRASGGGATKTVSRPRRVVVHRAVPVQRAPKRHPKPKPRPAPPPAVPMPMTVDMLIQLLNMDLVPPQPPVDKPPLR